MAEPLKKLERELSPAEALQLLEEHARTAQDALASNRGAGADVLHYLAKNGAPATRRAVAANPEAPPESNLLLADDGDAEVRRGLAQKIGRLFPGLLDAEQKSLGELTISTLEKLARDEVASVRAMLADEIKHHECVPKNVVKQLAGDADPQVSTPVLEFSPLLEDRDLIEIIAASRASNILGAVARRKKLSSDVSDAVATTLDIGAVSELLANTSATIRTKTLDKIISNAAEVSEWHGSLVVRADLSRSAMRRLASFVASAYIDSMVSRAGLDEATRKHLKRQFEERRKEEAESANAGAGRENFDVDKAFRAGTLNEAFVAEAVEDSRKETVVRALSVLAKADEGAVRRIIESKSADAATSLVWRAGLSMRVAYKLQTQVMRLVGDALLYPRGGVDFPLTEEKMRWHLGFYGVA